jgi:hypothetical protein
MKDDVPLSGLRLVPRHYFFHQDVDRRRLVLEDQATGRGERQHSSAAWPVAAA